MTFSIIEFIFIISVIFVVLYWLLIFFHVIRVVLIVIFIINYLRGLLLTFLVFILNCVLFQFRTVYFWVFVITAIMWLEVVIIEIFVWGIFILITGIDSILKILVYWILASLFDLLRHTRNWLLLERFLLAFFWFNGLLAHFAIDWLLIARLFDWDHFLLHVIFLWQLWWLLLLSYFTIRFVINWAQGLSLNTIWLIVHFLLFIIDNNFRLIILNIGITCIANKLNFWILSVGTYWWWVEFVRTCLLLRYSSSWICWHLRLRSIFNYLSDKSMIVIFLFSLSIFAFITYLVNAIIFDKILLSSLNFDGGFKSSLFSFLRIIFFKIRSLITACCKLCCIILFHSACISWLSSGPSSLTDLFVSLIEEQASTFIWTSSTGLLILPTYKRSRLSSRSLPCNNIANWRSASLSDHNFIIFLLHFLLVKCCFLNLIKQS